MDGRAKLYFLIEYFISKRENKLDVFKKEIFDEGFLSKGDHVFEFLDNNGCEITFKIFKKETDELKNYSENVLYFYEKNIKEGGSLETRFGVLVANENHSLFYDIYLESLEDFVSCFDSNNSTFPSFIREYLTDNFNIVFCVKENIVLNTQFKDKKDDIYFSPFIKSLDYVLLKNNLKLKNAIYKII